VVITCREKGQDTGRYDEQNYIEVSRGNWKGYYTITYESKNDSNNKMRILFADSTQNHVFYMKEFFTNDIMNGPMYVFSQDKLSMKGFMLNNKRHGELTFFNPDSTISDRNFYDNGLKTGVWEHFSINGILIRKTYYERGNFIKHEIFDRDGKYVRTRYRENLYDN
jgi:antitoxin component YwqK of YwqJK toxin-antitoxin module